LLKKGTWYEHEVNLAGSGTRAYRAISLFVRGDLIGLAVFCRRAPREFTPDHVQTLKSVAPPIGVALANALANERIRDLHDQLEAQNLAVREQTGRTVFDEIVGWSAALHRVLNAIDQVAPTDTTVLLTGETGTGKELIVRAIHKRSRRRQGPLIGVHCASVPQTLLASELFGHERGAFTGASDRRRGRFEQANGGTLFLDEIGELPGDMQVMLLRVLQERVFERLGGSQTIHTDVRVVAATNRDLDEEVRAGRFRSDLLYRLNVFPIRLPPLRERSEDIPHLVAHLAAKHGGRVGKTINRIDPRSMKLLVSHHWPGNVRELENVVERAVILSTNGVLKLDRGSFPNTPISGDLDVELRHHERETIEAALTASAGKVAGSKGAAARLGMAPSTLEFRIKRLGIDKMRFWRGRRD
jgi:formate hydrogenlyase transcriptional activator